MNYTLNLFGTSLRIWKCYIPNQKFEYFEKCRLELNLDWVSFLFDLEILNKLGYTNWSDLSATKAESYFILNNSNTIEIKLGHKRVLKSKIQEIENHGLLFPLYNTKYIIESNEVKEDFKLIQLIQEEIGLYGKYSIESDSFDINDLEFNILQNSIYNQLNLLKSVKFQGLILNSKNDDLLVNSFKVIV